MNCITPDPTKVYHNRRTGYSSLKVLTEHRIGMHVLSYLWNVGDIPDGMVVDHTCMNKECMEPSHLQLRNRGENAALDNRRRGVCRNGHTGERYASTPARPNGRCIECQRASNRRFAKSKGAQ